MEQMWNDILERFGQDVVLRRGEQEDSFRAIIQPYRESRTVQEVHGPLGLGRQERFRYLGPKRYPVELDTLVRWKEREYRVQSACLAGEGVCPYWWAVLYPREEAGL